MNTLMPFSAIVLVFSSLLTVTECSIGLSVKYIDIGVVASGRSNITTAGLTTSCSIGQCAIVCNRLGNGCHGFIFQDFCDVTIPGTGTCQPISLINPGDVVSNVTKCAKRIYIADPCSGDHNVCLHFNATSWLDIKYFDFLPGINMYVRPISEALTWGDATRRCRELSPAAHLIILSNLQEFQSLRSYLSALPSCNTSNTVSCSCDYWTAKRRLDVYTNNGAICMASPFIWDKDNTTSGQMPEQSWETAMWYVGQPDCDFGSTNKPQTCTVLPLSYNLYHMDDLGCWELRCPLCQLDVN